MNYEFKMESAIYYEITEFIHIISSNTYFMFHISYSRIIKFKFHMQSKVLKKKRSKKGRVTRNHFYLEAT